MNARLTRRALAPLLATLLLAACGGGVETGGTGAGGSYVEGTISGFGSIIVGAIRIDDSAARIEDADGAARDRGALRLGMQVEVEAGTIATAADGTRSASASRVRIAADLLGPVTALDAAGATLAVLGQTVRLGASTVVDGVVGGASGLRLGDVVEVHGFVDAGAAGDRYAASRIERRSGAVASYRLRGVVRDLDAAARTLRMGSQAFDLSTLGIPAGLANGALVRLTVQPAQVAGRWPVLALTRETRTLDDRDEAEVEGLVTALTSTSRFEVNGLPVDAAGATFVDGSAGVVVGARVKVRGRSAGGVLVAASVDLRSDDDTFGDGVDLRDTLSALDTTARTFVVRGVTVFYGSVPAPRFDNGSAADLADGKRVRVRARLAADRTRVVAERIEFD